ncbi:MAG: ABC transporter permease [Acidilobaceae archaeon]|nr:ABC transporter permease [Acidilobaceae archaeon]
MSLKDDLRALALVAFWDVRKLRRYTFFLAMRFSWFLLQVLVFGLLVANMVSVGDLDYYKFYVVGAFMAVLFSMSMVKGHDIVEEFEDGLVDYQLSLPVKRKVLAIGRAIGGGISAFLHSLPMLIVVVLVLGVSSLSAVLALALASFVFASSLSGIAMGVALILRSSDRLDILMGVSDSLLVRISTIFYPIAAISGVAVYYYLAKVNPVSHMVDALRLIAIPEEYQGSAVSSPEAILMFLAGFAFTAILSSLFLLDRKIEGGYGR